MREEIMGLIAESIGIDCSELIVTADLDDEYDMDSTEKADLARILEEKYKIRIEKSFKDSWNTAEDIISFVHGAMEI